MQHFEGNHNANVALGENEFDIPALEGFAFKKHNKKQKILAFFWWLIKQKSSNALLNNRFLMQSGGAFSFRVQLWQEQEAASVSQSVSRSNHNWTRKTLKAVSLTIWVVTYRRPADWPS